MKQEDYSTTGYVSGVLMARVKLESSEVKVRQGGGSFVSLNGE